MIGSLTVPDIDVNKIKQYSSYAWPIIHRIEESKKETSNLAALRDTLLPRLMSGEVDVSKIEV